MPMSLKCMIDKWLYKGQISQEEYDAVMKKLDGHDKQIRADAFTECLQIVQKIKDDYNDAKFGEQVPINYGTICGIIIAFEQLKGADNE